MVLRRSVRVLFDAEVPVFRLLGIPEAVKLMEQLRGTLRAKFSRLEEAFKAMAPVRSLLCCFLLRRFSFLKCTLQASVYLFPRLQTHRHISPENFQAPMSIHLPLFFGIFLLQNLCPSLHE